MLQVLKIAKYTLLQGSSQAKSESLLFTGLDSYSVTVLDITSSLFQSSSANRIISIVYSRLNGSLDNVEAVNNINIVYYPHHFAIPRAKDKLDWARISYTRIHNYLRDSR